MQMHWFGLVTLLSTGCYSNWETKDVDGDGVSGLTDCWESTEDPVPPAGAMEYDTPLTAADIFVGAEDRPYDGIDQNCDGLDDFDQDGDGFIPNAYVGIATVNLAETGTLPGGDCDDEDAMRHPDTEEVCDGVINGCEASLPEVELDGDGDGFVSCSVVDSGWLGDDAIQGGDDCDDEDPVLFPTQEWFGDSDDDGFGEAGDVKVSCTQPDGYELNDDDCNDEDGSIYPEAPELCDGFPNACGTELSGDEIDDDGDGYVECTIDPDGWDGARDVIGGEDCSDTDGTVFVSQTYYADGDADGFGDPNTQIVACELPSGYVLDANDCNDDDATVYLGAPELCDGQSNACATSIPANETDFDVDGFVECTIDGGGWDGDTSVTGGGDCDDGDVNEFPGQVWYADIDADTFGDPETAQTSCMQPSNTSLDNTDCNDGDDTVYLGAPELCDGQLNACGGSMLAGEVDADGDGYAVCTLVIDPSDWKGAGAVTGGDDCADDDAFTHPGAAFVDAPADCMRDEDGDGYGSTVVSGNIVGGTDCNDTDSTVHPNADELCDGLINTCVGTLPSDETDDDGDGYIECTIDNGGWDGLSTVIGGDDCNDTSAEENPLAEWFNDGDGDGFGDLDFGFLGCLQPTDFVSNSDDCDDTDDMTYPNAPEICDGVVNACGGLLPINEIDNDGDGFVACTIDTTGWDGDTSIVGGGDCVNTDALTYPGAASAESATDCMRDADLDGYGDDLSGQGFTPGHDCNDNEDTVYQGATELCDGQLNDCYSGGVPFVELDPDDDGWVSCEIDAGGWDGSFSIDGGGDCNPNSGNIHPYATEDADAVDDNCDGMEANSGIETCVGEMGSFNGTDKYFLFCDGFTRSSASASFLCSNSGYDDLASINSVNEMNFAEALASDDFLIGLERVNDSSPWRWMDDPTGTPSYYFGNFVSNSQSSNGTTNVKVKINGAGSVTEWDPIDFDDKSRVMCSTTF